jgi:BMFP domain-containing protein YqiC
VAEGMPRSLQILQGDLERNLRSALEAALRQLDLVSREEFEIQRAVLERTREKLEALEARISELEKSRP